MAEKNQTGIGNVKGSCGTKLENDQNTAEANEDDSKGAITGGLSDFKKVDHVITNAVSKVNQQIVEKVKNLTKLPLPEKLEVVGYRMNIVLGFIYFAKIKIPGESYVQARILETPQGDIELQSVIETKTDEDEREYFKLPKKIN